MKIAIIGPGAMGRLFAWFLARGGHRPLMVCRRAEQVAAFLQKGLTVVDLQGEEHVISVEASLGLDGHEDIDGAILTVKSYDTLAAGEMLRRVRPLPMLSLQNGLGNGETLAEVLSSKWLAIGLTTNGATAEGDVKVSFKGQGRTVIGNWADNSEADTTTAHWWAEMFAMVGHPLQLTNDIRSEVWKKAMVNIGINPFTALYDLRNGELLEREDLLPQMQQAVREAEAVAAAEGIELHESFANVLDVCRLTAQNRSSMLQDFARGRRTEIEALCGVVVRLGRKHGIATPMNEQLLKRIKESCAK